MMLLTRRRPLCSSTAGMVFLKGAVVSLLLASSSPTISLASSIPSSPSPRMTSSRFSTTAKASTFSEPTTKSSPGTKAHAHGTSSTCGHPTVPTNRRACGMYIWDAPSALLYKWCHYLLKDHIYEGRGGYLFVRYESNSILQLLYPCNRYSPNKCVICGGTFPDHLELWWSKHLYSPFDQYLDKTYNNALVLPTDPKDDQDAKGKASNRRKNSNGGTKERSMNRKGSSSSSTPVVQHGPPTYAYHRRYVVDVSDMVREIDDPRQRRDIIQKAFTKSRQSSGPKKDESKQSYVLLRTIPGTDVSYVTALRTSTDKRRTRSIKDAILDLVTSITLGSIDDMLYVQGIENRNLKKYKAPIDRL